MAKNDEWYGDDYYYDEQPADQLKDILFIENSGDWDMHAQTLFVEAFFDQNEQSYNELVDYLFFQYGLDFEADFEWEDFRDWYDATQ